MTNETKPARRLIDGVSVYCVFDEIADIKDLKENPQNPNKHPAAQIELLAEIIRKTGWRAPITVSNLSGYIVKGHGRLQAAKAAGFKHCPVEYQNFSDEEEEMAALLADNKLAELAEIDVEKLTEIFKDYEFEDLSLTGYSQEEFDELVDVFEEAELLGDPDEVPEEVETRCKLGDIWQLGNHRLMCGDSTVITNVEQLMNGEKADMVFTSPPYNNGGNAITSGDFNNSLKAQKMYSENGYSDNLESSKYIDFCKCVLNNAFRVTNGFVFWNVNYNSNAKYEYIKQIEDKLEYLVEQVCWKKQLAITITNGGMTRIWEPIYIFSTNKEKIKFKEVINNHWEISNINASYEKHRACFPVKLPEYAIKMVNKDIDKVLDLFGGSGSTLIACEQQNCKCYAMELDPHYCDVIITRWETLTGKKAVKLNK